ncbi:MAG: DUF3108 domain-containing protein [Pseudomonadota bacterium]
MSIKIRIFLVAAAWLASASLTANDAPGASAAAPVDVPVGLTPHAAEYKVKVSGVSGRLTTRLERRGGDFEALHVVEATGFAGLFARGKVRELSRFGDFGRGLLPLHYEARNTLRQDSGASLDFDWDDGRVTGSLFEDGTNTSVDVALDEPMFDRLAIQYRLMADLARGGIEALDASDDQDAQARTSYVLFDGDESDTLDITPIGERAIKTRAGTFDTIGVQHQKQGSKRRTLLWLAPELDYLPVLIEQYRRDDLKVRATLRDYDTLDD